MKYFQRSFYVPVFMLIIMHAGLTSLLGQEKETERTYQGANDFEVTIITSGGTNVGKIKSDYDYSFKTFLQKQDLLLHSFKMISTKDGQVDIEGFMNHDKFVVTLNGQRQEILRDESQPRSKIFFAIFDNPISHIEFDENGGISKREDVDNQLLKDFKINEMISYILFFNFPFNTKHNQWDRDVELNAGPFVIKGKLNFSKIRTENQKQIVGISGTGRYDTIKFPAKDNILMRDFVYTTKGDETYDESRQTWIDGDIAVDFSSRLTYLADDSPDIGSLKGRISWKMNELIQKTQPEIKKEIVKQPVTEEQKQTENKKTIWRTWTSANGKFTVTAKYVKESKDSVSLENKNGKIIEVKKADLSKDDLEWIKK